MVDAAGKGPITGDNLTTAHRLLMAPDFYTARDSGIVRDVQNWIGGSDHTPVDALYVPPPPELVHELMTDLLAFTNRTDLPILAQAAIAHAQFQSIHPFTDGNGRIGRALISAILRRRGLTGRVTVPLASVLLADTGGYFDRLTDCRAGDADGFVEYVAHAATVSSYAAQESARALAELLARHRATPRQFGGREDHRRPARHPDLERGHGQPGHRHYRCKHLSRPRSADRGRRARATDSQQAQPDLGCHGCAGRTRCARLHHRETLDPPTISSAERRLAAVTRGASVDTEGAPDASGHTVHQSELAGQHSDVTEGVAQCLS